MSWSLPHEEDKEKRRELRSTRYSDEWFRKIRDRVKARAMKSGVLFELSSADVKELYQVYSFSCFRCKQRDTEVNEALSVTRFDTKEGYAKGNVCLYCSDCLRERNYTPPKKKKSQPQSQRKSIWNLKESPIRRITYHAAARYYQRFEHRTVIEGNMLESDFYKAQKAVQKISFLWKRVDRSRYQYENAIFVVDRTGKVVVTIYPSRELRPQRIRRPAGYYQNYPMER